MDIYSHHIIETIKITHMYICTWNFILKTAYNIVIYVHSEVPFCSDGGYGEEEGH